jgi:S1-C subfamily serine protease
LQAQPRPQDFSFDLEHALQSVVKLQTTVPEDAFTANTLGTERAGSGVLIRDDGLILTIGYLVTEAETVWLSTSAGMAVPGHVLAYDQETGLGLVQALGRLELPVLELGRSARLRLGDELVVAAGGGRRHAIKSRLVARQEFAGYWEYLLDDALFTAPAHPFWGGTAAIGADGTLIGIGSLHVQQASDEEDQRDVNMIVPVDVLRPILDDLLIYGRPNRPARPWLGMYSTLFEDAVVIAGVSENGPARAAGLRTGDAILSVAGERVSSLPSLYRKIWATGNAGTEIPISLFRDGKTLSVSVKSADRSAFLKSPKLH